MKLQPKQKQRLLREVFESINEMNHSDPIGDIIHDFEEAIEKLWTVVGGLDAHPGIAAAIESHTTALDSLSNKLGQIFEPSGAPEAADPELDAYRTVEEVNLYLDYSGMDVSDIEANGGPDGVVQMMINDGETGIMEDDEGSWMIATQAVEDWMRERGRQ